MQVEDDFGLHRLIPLADAIHWREALENVPHDFFHTWDYNRAIQLTHGLPTYLYCFNGSKLRVACPLAMRRCAGETDITTPPGFSGFVGAGIWQDFSSRWTAFARRQGWVCGYIGLNPILSPAAQLFRGDAATLQSNDIYILDLNLDADALLERMTQGRRRELRRRTHSLVTDRKLLTEFVISEYAPFMRRLNAAASYHRSAETLAALCELENVLLIGGEGPHGVAAAYVFTYTTYVATYLFTVAVPGARKNLTPTIWHAIQQLKLLGVGYLNLGAGIRQGDSIARSKQRFGAQRLPCFALAQVYDPKLYNALCAENKCDPTTTTGYFPAYRAPKPNLG